MRSGRQIRRTVTSGAAAALVCLLLPRLARAFLDPGTGSYLFQLLIAGLLGGVFVLKLFWARIRGWCRGLFSKRCRHEPPPD